MDLKQICLGAALTGLVGLAGCSDYVGSANGYSCEKRSNGKIIAVKGEKTVILGFDNPYKTISYKNMSREEALGTIDACVAAFGELDKQKK
jgi:hypothetical protein